MPSAPHRCSRMPVFPQFKMDDIDDDFIESTCADDVARQPRHAKTPLPVARRIFRETWSDSATISETVRGLLKSNSLLIDSDSDSSDSDSSIEEREMSMTPTYPVSQPATPPARHTPERTLRRDSTVIVTPSAKPTSPKRTESHRYAPYDRKSFFVEITRTNDTIKTEISGHVDDVIKYMNSVSHP